MAFLESTGGDPRLEQAERFTSELGWKIFLDRYTLKDIERQFRVGDLAIVMVEPHPKWPKKDIGLVRDVHPDATLSVELLTGPQKGDVLVRKFIDCDRPLETTLDEVAGRIASGVAAVESLAVKKDVVESFQDELAHLRFVPGGRIWAGAGTNQNLTYFNCYVLPNPRDSREGIVETLGQMIEIMSRGGGVGINVSSLRPSRAPVRGVNGRSSGAVSWMDLYSRATGLVEQGGCFGPDERIATDQGLIPAEELAHRMDMGEKFLALTHEGLRPITARFVNGEKQLYEVLTARGFRVEVTEEHKMGVLRQGTVTTVPLQALAVGDEILTVLGGGMDAPPVRLEPPRRVGSIMPAAWDKGVTFPDTLGPELAYVLGYMHGDGCAREVGRTSGMRDEAFALATADDRPAIRERLRDYLSTIWSLSARVEPELGVRPNVALGSRLVRDWLQQNGLLSPASEAARVPDPIFRSNRVVAGAFVAGYLDADRSDGSRHDERGFDSQSLPLLRDLQQILAIHGMATHIEGLDRSTEGSRGTVYRLAVTDTEGEERLAAFAHRSLTLAGSAVPGSRGGDEGGARPGPQSLHPQRLGNAMGDGASFSVRTQLQDGLEPDGGARQGALGDRGLRVVPDPIISALPTRITTTYDFEVAGVHMLSGSGVYTSNSRRGALMLQIEDWHPDIWRFIDVKKTPGMVENANISIRVSDRFMDAVKEDGDWELVFPDTRDPDYDQLWTGDLEAWQARGKSVVVYETTKARQVWHEITKGAWEAAEPGIVFDERHEKESNSWYFNPLVCTNPCAEQPLPAWGVCTLGHLNLAAFYDAVHHDVDWKALRKTVRMGVRFLDDIVDATPYFFDENRENQERERRIGMGTMGLGELLIRVGLRYGSPESIAFIDRLYQFIATEAYIYDAELAREKGPFPAFDADKYLESGFMKKMPESVRDAVQKNGARNVTILTQAPTGTVGSMVGTSTGIEPFYALTYFRQSRLGFDEQFVPVAQEWKAEHPEEELPPYFVGAMDLTPEEHIYVQAAIQRWTDSSISKTANAPSTYTVEDTARLYELAYELGCKGVTIYRDQSRQEQVLHLSDQKASAETVEAVPATRPAHFPSNVEVYPVPTQVVGRTYRRETPAGTARVVINEVDNDPFEVFMLLGRAGSEVQSFMEALGRVISLYLRSSGDLSPRRRLQLVADQLKGIGGANQMGFGPERVLSVVDAIGLILDRHLNPDRVNGSSGEGPTGAAVPPASKAALAAQPKLDLCPQCDAPTLVYEEGCAHCQNCGYSRC